MKKLFICLTDFQILNALNLQVNNENNEDADIFFVTNKQGNEELAARLQATKIFKNVYLFNNSKISSPVIIHLLCYQALEQFLYVF